MSDNNPVVSSDLIKRGEVIGQSNFRRTKRGTLYTVKLHPGFEELIAGMSNGSRAVSEYGREWISPNQEVLQVYDLAQELGAIPVRDFSYALAPAGRPLTQKDGAGRELLNISFIRLVGVSGPAGKSFELRGVYSVEYLRQLHDKLHAAMQHFYAQYLLPIDMTIVMQTQEMRG